MHYYGSEKITLSDVLGRMTLLHYRITVHIVDILKGVLKGNFQLKVCNL